MIPATNTKLLVSEDWKKVYQSFRSADFKSYDFETLRRTMISYLQENYPEDFNDFIDSSEYVALIDLIAYLGQNLSFRIDLNARENFIETAQRRDSILRLAQLISYNPKRNIPAHGFLKITSISTTDSVIDASGVNLANSIISWNDPTNPDWYQQFINIINSVSSSNFGDPTKRDNIGGILNEQYLINSSNIDVPIFNFSKNINGTTMEFEVTPCTFTPEKNYVYEEAPRPAAPFSLLYKNDNQGSASINTGFFVHFRQGTLSLSSFTLDNPVPNEIIGVNTPNINDTDVWLWQLDKDGNYSTLWTQVPSLTGNNIIYNSLNKNLRTIYAVSTRDEDQIDLNFADGAFGDLPKGNFRLFYRQSNGSTYTIKPEQMSGISISIPYVNSIGQNHTLQLIVSLQYTISNSSGPESNISIQTKAPQAYYTQNRMITGEDYNISPLTAGPDILKVKSINRISSGLSKYFDISDITGAYSKTNIYGNDGILYKDEKDKEFEFSFTSRNQLFSIINTKIYPIINSSELKSFYIDKYPVLDLSSFNLSWNEVNKTPGQSRGYFSGLDSSPTPVGQFSQGLLKFMVPGSTIKLSAPTNYYFDSKNNLKSIPSQGTIPSGGKFYIWSTVKQVIGDGAGNGYGILSDGTGPLILSSKVPQNSRLTEIIPKYIDQLGFSIENEIVNICSTQRNFGLTFDSLTRKWDIILNSNLNVVDPFSLNNQGNVNNQSADTSWLIAFIWTGSTYKVKHRSLNYVFESEQETAFYINENSKNFDSINNTVVFDKIDVLSVNPSANNSQLGLGVDYSWKIDEGFIESDGYVDPKKIKVSFNKEILPQIGESFDPSSFINIVGDDNFIYFKKNADENRYNLTREDIIPMPNEDFFNRTVDKITLKNGTLYYFYDEKLDYVKYWDKESSRLIYTDLYFGKRGRSDLKFYYSHNSGQERRIDPSKTNIIDVYLLTISYDNDFRSYLIGNSLTEPEPPTSHKLDTDYREKLEKIKSISDEIIFHPAKYKILFGDKATKNLQAKFKAVRNPDRTTTDNDLKTRILASISEFFSLENWEFGQSFYFSELSAYVMNNLTPDITNFIIVPTESSNGFGSLYEVSCLSNEILISGASISDIEIIDAVTASQLKTPVNIVTTSGN